MKQLYSPIITNAIPAFCGKTLQVFFSLPVNVNIEDIASVAAEIRLAANQKKINELTNLSDKALIKWTGIENNYSVTFDLNDINENNLIPGSFYQIRIAFVYKQVDELIGSWTFNSDIDLNNSLTRMGYNITFASGDNFYTHFNVLADSISYDDVEVFSEETWKNEAYKMITIYDVSNLSSRSLFTEWLKNNAEKAMTNTIISDYSQEKEVLLPYSKSSEIIQRIDVLPMGNSESNPNFLYAIGKGNKTSLYLPANRDISFQNKLWILGKTHSQTLNEEIGSIHFIAGGIFFNKIKIDANNNTVTFSNEQVEKIVFNKNQWDGKYSHIVLIGLDSLLEEEKRELLLQWLKEYSIIPTVLGPYSILGVSKYTAAPSLSIDGLTEGNYLNYYQDYYIGRYINVFDPSEKVISYQFIIYGADKQTIILSSGRQSHFNEDTKSISESIDTWSIDATELLESNQVYFIQYEVETVNHLRGKSPYYKIVLNQRMGFDLGKTLLMRNDFENGYIELSLKESGPLKYNEFMVMRTSVDRQVGWAPLALVSVGSNKENEIIFRDFTVEQGVTYAYGVALSYNNQIISKIYSAETLDGKTTIVADFEDMFLYDGERQLKIRWNPQMSSFKLNSPEQKQETLGNQFPFIFKNKVVAYKEFPIAGLLSYNNDEQALFYNFNDVGVSERRDNTPEANTRVNILLPREKVNRERQFKMEVLNWLNNNSIKLFRSATEGNYLVKTINTSLSPEDSTGRVLHKLSSTCVEMDKYNIQNLQSYNILRHQYIDIQNDEIISGEINLEETFSHYNQSYVFPSAVMYAQLQRQFYSPITMLLTYSSGESITVQLSNYDVIDTRFGTLTKITYINGEIAPEAKIIYQYKQGLTVTQKNNLVIRATVYNLIEQHIGEGQSLLSYINPNGYKYGLSINEIFSLTVLPKLIIVMTENEYENLAFIDPTVVYQIQEGDTIKYYMYNGIKKTTEPDKTVIINKLSQSIEKETILTDSLENLETAIINDGVNAIINYQISSPFYVAETRIDLYPELANARLYVKIAQDQYKTLMTKNNWSQGEYTTYYNILKDTYNNYSMLLNKILIESERE